MIKKTFKTLIHCNKKCDLSACYLWESVLVTEMLTKWFATLWITAIYYYRLLI